MLIKLFKKKKRKRINNRKLQKEREEKEILHNKNSKRAIIQPSATHGKDKVYHHKMKADA